MAVLKRLFIALLAALLCSAPAIAHAAPEDEGSGNPTFQDHVEECIETTEAGPETGEGSPARALQDWADENITTPEWLDNLGDRVVKNNCRVTSAVSHPIAAASAAASKFWGDPVGDFTKAVLEGNAEALQTVMTFWTDYKLDSATVDSSVQGVKNIVLSLAGLALIASMIAGGYKIANDRRRGLIDSMEETGGVIARYLLFGTLIPPLVVGAVVASDRLSDWIMESFGASSAESVLGAAQLNESMGGPILMLAFAGVAFAGSIMQIIALAVRTLLLPIAAGLTPLFAALSFSQTARSGLSHLVSLMIASVIFKPVSALLYCVVFWMSGTNDDSLVGLLISVSMIGAAGFTGPALVRALVPAVSQAGGGGAAPLMAAGGAAGGAALGVASTGLGALGRAAGNVGSSASSSASGGSGGQGSGSLAGAGANPGGGGPSSGGSSVGGRNGGGPDVQGGPSGANPGGGARGGGASSGANTSGANSGGGSHNGGHGNTGPSGAHPGGSANPSGANGSGNAGGRSVQSPQPQGARASHGGARARMGAIGRGTVRKAGAVARGASKASAAGARAAHAGGSAASRIQGILDDSMGQQGNYHGNVRR